MKQQPAWRRYGRLLGSDPLADVDEELTFHLEARVEDLVRAGLPEAEARTRALREFGDVERVRSDMRAIGRGRLRRERQAGWWEGIRQDVRFAARSIRKAPGFAALVAATLALGVGGTTAVFSVVQAVLLAPLPYEDPGRLVRFYQHNDNEVDPFREFLTGPHLRALREETTSFEEVGGLYTYRETGLDLTEGGRAERLRVLEVSSGYFRALGAPPSRGREFEPADEVGAPRVVLSHRVWQGRLDGRADVLGSTLDLSGAPYTVVGIAPEGLEDPVAGPVDAWLPLDLARSGANHPDNHFLSAVGRLRGGVSPAAARAELAGLNRTLAERWPQVAADTLILVPLKEDVVGASRGTLSVLLLAVGLVLLVACVNVANLLLVRSTGRVREFAVRSALGSGRGRIVRQLLVESVLLAALGGVAGLLLALAGTRALRTLGAGALPRIGEVGFDPVVLAFAALVTLATGVAFGVVPAVRFARVQPSGALREQSRSSTGTRGQGRLRTLLAVTQLGLALTLLAGAGVLMASFHNLQSLDLGFRTERVLVFDLTLPDARYDAVRRAAFQEELARRLETLPGVSAAGGSSRLPATGTYHGWGTRILTGTRAGTDDEWTRSEQRIVSGRFLDALEVPLLAGRLFSASDDADAPKRGLVSARFAREAFPGLPLAEVVGQRIAPINDEMEIIGVVGDVALDARGAPAPTVYHAHRQMADDRNWVLTQAVATALDPERMLGAVRAEVAALDPELVVHRPASLAGVVGQGVGRERFALLLMAAFATVALLLAALGLYGVLAYAVRQRSREIGVRIALGATAAQVRRLVLRQAAVVVGLGTLVGLGGALLLGRWLSALVFEVSPWDPRIFAATAALLAGVAGLSAALPARRASRVEPRSAMESE